MATIKSFTDIPQSKKLAEILPLDSADMHLTNSSIKGEMYTDEFKPVLGSYLRAKDSLDAYSKIVNNMIAWEVIPCWSLATLLNVLPNNENISTELSKGGYRISTLEYTNSWFVDYEDETNGLNNCVTSADNPVDACYEMILKLHELKML